MVCAAVPKAAVDEHSDLRPREHDVRSTADAPDGRLVDSVAETTPMERTPHGEFAPRIPLSLPLELVAHGVGRGRRAVTALSH